MGDWQLIGYTAKSIISAELTPGLCYEFFEDEDLLPEIQKNSPRYPHDFTGGLYAPNGFGERFKDLGRIENRKLETVLPTQTRIRMQIACPRLGEPAYLDLDLGRTQRGGLTYACRLADTDRMICQSERAYHLSYMVYRKSTEL